MKSNTIVVDPMTRIEGHLRFETRVEGRTIIDARVSGEMFRGIERALEGYDARVAQHITERVCGVCPYAHGEAASLALEDALGIRPPPNGQRLRNLIVGAYQLHDYLFHFYVLCILDFIDIEAILAYSGRAEPLASLREWVRGELAGKKVFPATPFLPRYEADYLEDTEANLSTLKNYFEVFGVLSELQKMVALFGAKAPHPTTMEAGGVTTRPSLGALAKYSTSLDRVERFVRGAWRPDLIKVSKAFRRYFDEGRCDVGLMSFPYFSDDDGAHHAFAGGASFGDRLEPLDLDAVTEDHRYSFYEDLPDSGRSPLQGSLQPSSWERYKAEHAREDGKYSWIRAPRYRDRVIEVGPAARLVNTYRSGVTPDFNQRVDATNRDLGIGIEDYPSVMGRHVARLLCAGQIIDLLRATLDRVEPDVVAFEHHPVAKNARGVGVTEASRGGLAHFIETDGKGHIARYELVVPSTWNFSPRDARGRPGAVEQMLIGTEIRRTDQPMELARIIRAADPCIACSVH